MSRPRSANPSVLRVPRFDRRAETTQYAQKATQTTAMAIFGEFTRSWGGCGRPTQSTPRSDLDPGERHADRVEEEEAGLHPPPRRLRPAALDLEAGGCDVAGAQESVTKPASFRARANRGRPCQRAKLRRMNCVCGCGRNVPKNLTERNLAAAAVALELLAWDKNRLLPGPGPDGREGLIARGVECYDQLLYSLHGEGNGDPDDGCTAWLEESQEMRAGRTDMTKKRFLRASTPNLSQEDLARLDRRHPERSFTDGEAVQAASSPVAPPIAPPSPAALGDDADLVAHLERLRALRDEGVLTDEEFAAAKARLLDHA
jgi:hypothetical protein